MSMSFVAFSFLPLLSDFLISFLFPSQPFMTSETTLIE